MKSAIKNKFEKFKENKQFFKKISLWSKKLLVEGIMITQLFSCSLFNKSVSHFIFSSQIYEFSQLTKKTVVAYNNMDFNLLNTGSGVFNQSEDQKIIKNFKKFSKLIKQSHFYLNEALTSSLSSLIYKIIEKRHSIYYSSYSSARSIADEWEKEGYITFVISETKPPAIPTGPPDMYFAYGKKQFNLYDFNSFPSLIETLREFDRLAKDYIKLFELIEKDSRFSHIIDDNLKELKNSIQQTISCPYYLLLLSYPIEIKLAKTPIEKTLIEQYANSLNSYSAINDQLIALLDKAILDLKTKDSLQTVQKSFQSFHGYEITTEGGEIREELLYPSPIVEKISCVCDRKFSAEELETLKNSIFQMKKNIESNYNNLKSKSQDSSNKKLDK
ncbi:MAG: hypothetical protein QXV83_01410 [Candidatus Anstonellaceae archaeon]